LSVHKNGAIVAFDGGFGDVLALRLVDLLIGAVFVEDALFLNAQLPKRNFSGGRWLETGLLASAFASFAFVWHSSPVSLHCRQQTCSGPAPRVGRTFMTTRMFASIILLIKQRLIN
jgi:hypothetical protein